MAGRDQDAQRDRQIKAARIFGKIGRCEVDGDPAGRKFEPARQQCGTNPLTALAHACVRQPDNQKIGQTGPDMSFHPDRLRLKTIQRPAGQYGQ